MEVEDNRARNDGHAHFSGWKSDATRFQVLHNARGSVQAESTPSAEKDGVHALYHVAGKAGSQIARTRGGTANIHSADGARFAEDNGAPRQTLKVARVSNADAWNCVQIEILSADLRERERQGRSYSIHRSSTPPRYESSGAYSQMCLRVDLI